jgi:CubicO group peptidase (beta-lactamase class C family)
VKGRRIGYARHLGIVLTLLGWLCGEALGRAEANGRTISTRTALINELVNAALDGNQQAVSHLLTSNLNVNAGVGPGLTAWQAAEIRGHSEIQNLLQKHGADTNIALPKREAVLDWYIRQKTSTNSPGLALAIVRDGNPILERGWGLANLEYDIPITPSTVFHVASVSKQFTACATALLIQQGKLSLGDDMRKYLPQMHDFGTTVTIQNLLGHTSGLRNYFQLLPLTGERSGDVVTQDEVMKLLQNQTELTFSPGEQFAYCNSGYVLLSEIVAKASGKSFGDFTRDEIFEPLGMTNSHFHTNVHEIVKSMAYCYYLPADGVYLHDILNYENVGSTSLFTTAEDLAKWIANFQKPKPGWAAVQDMMQAPGHLNNGDDTGYGMGLFVEKYRGARLIQHGGADASYRAFVLWFPDLHLGVALLSNFASTDSRDIALTAAEVYLNGKLSPVESPQSDPELPSVSLTAAQLDKYVGKYEFPSGSVIADVSRVSDHLEIREDNDAPFALVSNGKDRFSAGKRSMTFQELDSGAALQFTNNWKEAFRRINAEVEKLPDLNAYVGDYWSNELETFLRIHLRGGQLVLELRRHGETPLRYVSRDVFATSSKDWWFDVKFERNSQAMVTGLRLNGLKFQRRQLE